MDGNAAPLLLGKIPIYRILGCSGAGLNTPPASAISACTKSKCNIYTEITVVVCTASAGIIGTLILLWSWHPEPSACLGSFYEIVVCLIHFVWITYIACMNLLEHQVSSSRFDFYSSRHGNHLTIPSISISMVARLLKNGQNCF